MKQWTEIDFKSDLDTKTIKNNVSYLVCGTLPNMLIEAYLDVPSLATRGQN